MPEANAKRSAAFRLPNRSICLGAYGSLRGQRRQVTLDGVDIALHTAYALLGIPSSATPTEIRRAFRRQVVTWHRARVIALADHIQDLTRAYALIQAQGPGALPQEAAVAPPAAPPPGWSRPASPIGTESGDHARYRTEGRLRTQAATEFSSCAARQGAEAVAANEAKIDAILHEDGCAGQTSKPGSLSRWLGLRK
jgi:hypothetical protein